MMHEFYHPPAEKRSAVDTMCAHCKAKLATCVGRYEGHGPVAPACDDCCGHGHEDGWCTAIDQALYDLCERLTYAYEDLDKQESSLPDPEQLLELQNAALNAARDHALGNVESSEMWQCVLAFQGAWKVVLAERDQLRSQLKRTCAEVRIQMEHLRMSQTELRELRNDVRRGLRIGYEVTEETQTVEEMAADLVRIVEQAREQRDTAMAVQRNAMARAEKGEAGLALIYAALGQTAGEPHDAAWSIQHLFRSVEARSDPTESDLVRSLNDQLTTHQEALDRVIAERDDATKRAEAAEARLAEAVSHVASVAERYRQEGEDG